jgi:citronellyl-CoA dehydrogenase
VTVARKLDKLGMRASDTAQVFFEGVRVPQRYCIGEEGAGFTYQMLQFQEERLWSAAASLLPMERMIGETIAYTGQRQVFGRPVLDNQVVHFRLAELRTEAEALRALTYRAAALMLQREDVTMLASMAKLKSGRLLREIADACLQYYGGMGFMSETPISRDYRDARLWSIGAGTDEIMLSIIAKRMGILPRHRS